MAQWACLSAQSLQLLLHTRTPTPQNFSKEHQQDNDIALGYVINSSHPSATEEASPQVEAALQVKDFMTEAQRGK